MNRFDIEKTNIQGLFFLKRQPIGDDRGYLERLFCSVDLKGVLGEREIVQINHTKTLIKGTIRGMHYQLPPYAEMKLVSCLKGEVFDVAVDLRRDSSTFLKWHAEILSESNHRTMVIPEGFAHGFQTLTDDCELIYMHTEIYNKDFEAGLDALDNKLAIDWPMGSADRSSRDKELPAVDQMFNGVVL